ncbi:ADP-ribose pyrophosphatase [Granulibacter bethesdensis]|uniref:ADP-ribose pyrophosphatase n=1 Tax=Granulibacter bethesdensis TaxID=364410 RepID=A0AAC9K7B1_9PROT|nr:NUDIX domain-containing protein [Granulibacter bethesdensis]APH54265.1 ADP-ribose pyrophosphatase [Granulibacter bethesdensis]APH61850.1 ADP-ribose pyrophosphatase [Granulibacter bethesdensis]
MSDDFLPLPSHADIKIKSRHIAWKGRYAVELISFRNRRFDGAWSGLQRWEIWRRGKASAVLPYDPASDTVILIEQIRIAALAAGLEPVMTEIPAGMRDSGEDPAETAHRECLEETGLTLKRLIHAGNYLLTPGGSDETLSLYIGEANSPALYHGDYAGTGGLRAENEDIRIRVVPARQAIEAAIAGQFSNVVTTVALLWLAAQRDRIKRDWLGRDE